MRLRNPLRRAVLAGVLSASLALAARAEVETFATFPEVAVGVATSKDGRVFVSFSRAIDETAKISVAEVVDGKAIPFPPGFKQEYGPPTDDRLLSVQALIVDGQNRLWMLDCGKVGNTVAPGAPKLVAYDLSREKVVKRIKFPASVAGKTSFLNDLRIDLGRGKEGTIYITDASPQGPNGIVVVDVASGRSRRRLNDHPSTRPEPDLTLRVGGQPLLERRGPNAGQPLRVGADGIALSADGRHLYYSPLTSRRLFRVSAEALAADGASDERVNSTVEELGDKGFAADGMLIDAQNRLYSTDFEHGRIHRRNPNGKWEVLAQDPKLAWPDTLAFLPNGTLLVTATQIHRSPWFRESDERTRPFAVLRIATDATPDFGPVKAEDAPPARPAPKRKR